MPSPFDGKTNLAVRGKKGTDSRQWRSNQRPWRKRCLSPLFRNLLIGALLFLAAACNKKEETKAEGEAPAPVQVTAVTQDTIRRIVSGDGVLYPKDQASVSPKLAAPVTK